MAGNLGGPGNMEESLRNLEKLAAPGWHQTWWGQLLIALVSGVAGGLIVWWLTV